MESTVAEPFEILRRTPEMLRALLKGLPETWTDTADTPNGWRPLDVVGHLITGEESGWLARTRRIIDHGTSKGFDPFDRVEMLGRDVGVSLDELVERFVTLRARNLAEFESLVGSDADLDRRGLHPSLGEVTLGNLLNTWAVHDLDHVGQVFAGLAGSHDAGVGPWKTYLGILLRREDPSAIPG